MPTSSPQILVGAGFSQPGGQGSSLHPPCLVKQSANLTTTYPLTKRSPSLHPPDLTTLTIQTQPPYHYKLQGKQATATLCSSCANPKPADRASFIKFGSCLNLGWPPCPPPKPPQNLDLYAELEAGDTNMSNACVG